MTKQSEAERMAEMLEGNGKGRYLQRAAVSKDGQAVILRLTPDQAATMLDMIYEDQD